jgi:hypothetical protein
MAELKTVFAGFENLGDNCEFGIAQRCAGIEPLGLFRFSGTAHLPAITAAIESGLEKFGEPGDVELFGDKDSHISVHIRSANTIYATPIRWSGADAEAVLRKETTKIGLLKRKFIEDLEDGNKIFVRKGLRDKPEQIRALSDALRNYGPNTLLWVTEADAEHPNGTVEHMYEGVIAGRIEKFAPPEAVPHLVFEDWAALCQNCLMLIR